jgi:PAS domain S-box-containing protein/TyrR family helix-turn-helix protein
MIDKYLVIDSLKLNLKDLEDELIMKEIKYIFMQKRNDIYYTSATNFLNQFKLKEEVTLRRITNGEGIIDDHIMVDESAVGRTFIDFESILTSLFDIVHITDKEGNTLYCSNNYEDFFGIDPSKMIGKNIAEFYNLGYFNPSITQRVLNTKKKTTTIQTTYKNRKIFVEGSPYFDNQGSLNGVINVSTDITHKEKLLKELKEIQRLGELYFEETLKHLNETDSNIPKLIYRSEVMNKTIALARRLSQFDSSIILTGETGVGKGVLVRYIHDNSQRKNGEFIHINCGAIPENLIESELFGYVKGAYTGAVKEGKEGLIEKANGGTLFLDEIAELPINLQVKLLTVLQEKKLTRIGGSKPIDVDIRLITATNRDLNKMVEEGKFREDLYYRIFVIPIELPPLRDRKEDIPILIRYFLDLFSQRYYLNRKLSEKCYQILELYHWPGNVRELENLVERLVVTSNGEIITSDQIPLYIKETIKPNLSGITIHEMMPLPEAIIEVEKQLLQMAHKQYASTTKVAKALGISQASASRKLSKYSIQ